MLRRDVQGLAKTATMCDSRGSESCRLSEKKDQTIGRLGGVFRGDKEASHPWLRPNDILKAFSGPSLTNVSWTKN